jgi:type IV pilus assembly protein PilM
MLGSTRILGLDIGAASVKLGEFQITKGQGLRLLNYNYADLGLDPEHEENRKTLVLSTIRNLLREKGIRRGSVVFSVSGQAAFTRYVKLPPVDESKVVQIIQYEAQQNVPFPIDEVVWDYQLIGNNPQGELEVVLLAIKSNIIDEINDAVESAGLRTEKVDVAPMALYNSVRFNYGDLEGCTVMLDIGARTTNLLFIEQKKVFSRSIPIAGNAITQSIAAEFNVPFLKAEELKKTQGFVALGGAYEEPEDETQARVSKIIRNVMTRLHAEVGRSINFYRTQQGGGAPARVFLSGGSAVLPYTDRFFQEKFSVPIEYFNPFRNVEIGPGVTRDDLAKCAHFMGEVVGLGLRQLGECPIEVNLLPTTLRHRRQAEEKRPYLAGIAAGLLLIPLAWWAYESKTAALHVQQLDIVRTKVRDLETVQGQIKDEQGHLDELQTKASRLASLVEQRSFWPALMEDMSKRTQPNLWIVSMTPETGTGGAAITSPRTSGRRGAGAMPPMMMPGPGPGPGGGRLRPGGVDPEMMMEGGPPPGPAPAAAPSSPAEPPPANAITSVLIRGAGLHNFQNPGQDVQLVQHFAEVLGQSPFFDPTVVEIVESPALMSNAETFNYALRLKLVKPLFY